MVIFVSRLSRHIPLQTRDAVDINFTPESRQFLDLLLSNVLPEGDNDGLGLRLRASRLLGSLHKLIRYV